MCMDAVSHLLINDRTFQRLVSNPSLDLIHKQVLMALYSMELGGELERCKELLPVYLSSDWSRCETILDTLEAAGLIERIDGAVELTYRIDKDEAGGSCGCHL
ncbi:MAG: hypothetical protein HY914_09010 [Desulfomonile tiedjei]|nr:hypothetical protein [Desulfomonile tiedjei]